MRRSTNAPTVDSVTQRLLENRGFMVWFSAMAAFIGSTLLGVFSGSIAWAAAMLFHRAIKGEWMQPGPGPSSLVPSAQGG